MQSSSTPPPVPLTRSARWALTSLSLSLLLSSLGTSIANVGLPTLAQAFGAIFAQVQWVVLATPRLFLVKCNALDGILENGMTIDWTANFPIVWKIHRR